MFVETFVLGFHIALFEVLFIEIGGRATASESN